MCDQQEIIRKLSETMRFIKRRKAEGGLTDEEKATERKVLDLETEARKRRQRRG